MNLPTSYISSTKFSESVPTYTYIYIHFFVYMYMYVYIFQSTTVQTADYT